MAYVYSVESPDCLSLEMTDQMKGLLGSHGYHLIHRAKKSS